MKQEIAFRGSRRDERGTGGGVGEFAIKCRGGGGARKKGVREGKFLTIKKKANRETANAD